MATAILDTAHILTLTSTHPDTAITNGDDTLQDFVVLSEYRNTGEHVLYPVYHVDRIVDVMWL